MHEAPSRPPTSRWALLPAAVLVLLSMSGHSLGGTTAVDLLVIGTAIGWLWAGPRDPWGLAALTTAGIVRAATFVPHIHLHAGKAWQLLDEPFVESGPDLRYGDGWASGIDVLGTVFRGNPDTVHLTTALLTVVGAWMLYGVVRQVMGSGVTGWSAAVVLSTLPGWVAFATTEVRTVQSTVLAISAVYALHLRGRAGAWLATCAVGLLAHTQPLSIATAVALLVGAASLGRWGVVQVGAVLVGWRAVQLGVYAASGGSTGGSHLDLPFWNFVQSHPWGPGAHLVLADPTRTPVGLAGMAALGGLLALRNRTARWWLLPIAVDLLLALPQPLLPDRLRYQLPLQLWAVLLATYGLWAPGPLAMVRRWGGVLAIAFTWREVAQAPSKPWVWDVEYQLVRRATRDLPPDAVVAVSPAVDVDGAFLNWANRRSVARWQAQPDWEGADWAWRSEVDGDAPVPAGWVGRITERTRVEHHGTPGVDRDEATVGLYQRAP